MRQNNKIDFIFFSIILTLICFINISYAESSTGIADTFKDFLQDPSFSNGTFSGRMLQIFLFVSVLGIAPTIIISVTCFVRIIIVFYLLRTALGMQQSPPTQVLNILALFITFFVMQPAIKQAYTEGIEPMIQNKISEENALPKIIYPFKKFMLFNTQKKNLDLFYSIAKIDPEKEEMNTPLHVLLPAFMISEIHRAFGLGFLIFLPFLIIDIVISSILMALGMIMLPPVMISLPIKLVFFVLIDGWYLLTSSIIKGFIR